MQEFTIQVDTGMMQSVVKVVTCKTHHDAEFLARKEFCFTGPSRFIIVKSLGE